MRLIIFVCLFCSVNSLFAQTNSFGILLEPVTIPGLGGAQSYAFAQANGKWLIIGGRTDGLHRRQPFGAFTESGRNKSLVVIDPLSLQKWETSLVSLPVDLQDQLSSTNMQFHQEGNYLYMIGGYGYSDGLKKFTTYDKLTAVDVPKVINAIIETAPIQSFFRQISDTGFAVTGGHLKKIADTYYLIGGQKFIGRYNPMGPDHGPGFFQQYTNQVRKFRIVDSGKNVQIANYETITDEQAFHRRDNNVVPQILSNGEEGLTLFSGVFQQSADIPFLNAVTLTNKNYTIDNSFAQYYNHYHSAVLPLYSKHNQEMHSVFFGGIAQYYDSAGILVQNDEVPFVKTIARVTKDKQGNMAEYKSPVEMPALLGAGSEFILSAGVPHYPNHVIKLDSLNADTTLVGYVYGGIASTASNIFFINTGEESSASNTLFKIFVVKNDVFAKDKLNDQSNNGLQLQVFPDADDDVLQISFSLAEKTAVELHISDVHGKTIKKELLKGLKAGRNSVQKSLRSIIPGDIFWVTVKTTTAKSTQKIVVEP